MTPQGFFVARDVTSRSVVSIAGDIRPFETKHIFLPDLVQFGKFDVVSA